MAKILFGEGGVAWAGGGVLRFGVVCAGWGMAGDAAVGLRFPGAVRRHADVEAWFAGGDPGVRALVGPWFGRMRGCGADVRELLHDGQPTACVGDVAFGYVDAFRAHAAVGFFYGAMLDDPAGLLEGRGKRLRHVKLRWGRAVDDAALAALVAAAYRDVRVRMGLAG